MNMFSPTAKRFITIGVVGTLVVLFGKDFVIEVLTSVPLFLPAQ